ncbi:helix-turn-helix transcriptional regulator [Paenibacillus tarimensis]|uniref:helix-turn-helix transcriptional regulator n=1 Tax=Paenibacillus tarimensis TaxID=416012 RepID=UPI001F3F9083|nr:helix-turn-helix transcriptional regulator [Paenibacillus tarimensis]MCF2943299.1 helix-turn-helix transcriptional regulator [Paenibacillus tarimensis]
MNHQTRRQVLSAFLKAQRAKLQPEAFGLPAGQRRRTPGLRREEVAQLAGVSTTWYTWLEQGRDIQVSASVLECIAGALRLTLDERNYLYALAMDTGSGASLQPEAPVEISQPLQRIMHELRNCPVIISDRRCRIVGWNEAASHVFLDFERIPAEQRNMIQLLFERKEFRRLAVNWEHFVREFLAIFRVYYGQYVEDEWYEQFLNTMREKHADFNPLWERSGVRAAPEVVLEFRHAKAGRMLFHLTSLQVQGEADLRCSIYTPAPDSATESKLQQLMGSR